MPLEATDHHPPNRPHGLEPDPEPDLEIDITPYVCPMTFVRTRLALDRLAPGQTLAVTLIGNEPNANIPKTARELGHDILSQTNLHTGATRLLIRKNPPRTGPI